MSKPSVSLRLDLEGKETIKSGFDDIGRNGEGSAKRLSDAYQRASEDVDRAVQRQAAAAQKVSAIQPKTPIQAQIESTVGTTARGGIVEQDLSGTADFTETTNSARASAAAFSAGLAEQERRAAALRAVIDPLSVAQKRYDDELRIVGGLLAQGAIKEVEYAKAVDLAAAALQRAEAAASGQHGGEADAHMQAYAAHLAQVETRADSLRAALDPAWAAQQRYDNELAIAGEALKLGAIDADLYAQAQGRAAAALRTVTDAAGLAAEKQQALYREQAAGAQDDVAASRRREAMDAALGAPTQQQPAVVNLDRSSGAARQSGAVFEANAREQEDMAAAADKIRAALDPAWAAQKRFDDEVTHATKVYDAGALSEEEYAGELARLEGQLNNATRVVNGHSGAMRLNSTQMLIAEGATHRFVDSLLAGTSPMQAFMMQAGDVGNVLAMDDGGMAGGLAKVRALINPVTVGIAATTAVVVLGAIAWVDYFSSIDKLDALAQGTGRAAGLTADSMRATAEAAAEAGGISVGAASETQQAYIATGQIVGAVLIELTARTRDYAAATGQDVKVANGELAKSFADPAAGAETLNAKLGILTQGELEYIRALVEEGKATEAQAVLLNKLGPAIDGAADHITALERGWNRVKNAASAAFDAMGHAIDRAVNGGSVAERMQEVQRKLERASEGKPTSYEGNAAIYENVDDLKKQLASLQSQARQQIASANFAQTNADIQGGTTVADDFTGAASLKGYREKAGALRAALSHDMPVDERQKLTAALGAYTHAIDTFIPRQEQANRLSALDAQIAAAKTPAQKAALTAQREEVEQAGKVISSADAMTLAHNKGAAALANASHAGAGHAATLLRDAQSMEVSAAAALDVAAAYLKSTDAGLEAEARRKAATDATKKGIDVEAQARRQLTLSLAEGIAQGDKSTAAMSDETAARAKVLALVDGGTVSIAAMTDAMSDEASLSSLYSQKRQAEAAKDKAAIEAVTAAIKARTAALNDNHVTDEQRQAKLAIAGTDENIARMRDQADFAGDRTGAGDIEVARRAAEREAQDKFAHLREDDPARRDFVDNRVTEARVKLDTDRTSSDASSLRSEQDRAAASAYALSIIGKSADEQERLNGRFAYAQQQAEKLKLNIADIPPELMAARDAADANGHALKLAAAGMGELQQTGEQVAGQLFDPLNWKNWGDTGKSIIHEVEQELLKLAIINPLKNMLEGGGGGSLPTLSSVFSLIGHHASGTEYASGGASYLAENGPELVERPGVGNLAPGSRVINAGDTRRLLAGNDNGGGPTHNHFHLEGALVTQDVLDQMNAIGQRSTVQGAAGGAKLASTNFARTRRRTLGGGR